MSTNAFHPQGNTITFTANVAAPAAVQCVAGGSNQTDAYRIINAGTVTVFLGVGDTAANAANNAAMFSGNSAACVPLLPGTDEILIFRPNAFFTGTSGSAAVVYITPGEGL